VRVVRELSQAFALAVPHPGALRLWDDVAFFQAVQAVLAKRAPGDARPEEGLNHAVRQIISRAVAPEGVVDIFAAAGIEKSDISILSEEFLAEVRGMPQKNLAVELSRKLLQGELRTRRRQSMVQAHSFAEMLEQMIRRYQNRAIEAAQVIEELIQLAQDMRHANARGEALGLSEDELAFSDALETNDSAMQVLGDATLRAIAQELVRSTRQRHDRLDAARERARTAPRPGETDPAEAWLSAGQARAGDAHCAGASGGALRGLGVGVKRAPNSRPSLAVVSCLMTALGRYRAVRQSAQRRADQSVP